jgi:predicted site-specific integrase-resolvase
MILQSTLPAPVNIRSVPQQIVCYAQVSSSKQRTDLERRLQAYKNSINCDKCHQLIHTQVIAACYFEARSLTKIRSLPSLEALIERAIILPASLHQMAVRVSLDCLSKIS